MRVLYGNSIPKNMYSKIADLDSEVFAVDAEEFGGDTTMSKQTVIDLLEKNISTTCVAVDDYDNVIGYFQLFPMEKEFEKKYVKGEVSFKDLDATKILDSTHLDMNLYVWTIAIRKDYRGVKVNDEKEPDKKIPIVQLLHEGLIDAIVDNKKKGITIHKILGEGVSEKGCNIMKGLCGEDSLIHVDKKNEFYMYYSDFNPNCTAFSRCRNVEELKRAYSKNL